MKNNGILSYRSYLDLLTKEPQNSASDYATYIRESRTLLPFTQLSSTTAFLLDFTSKAYPFLSDNVSQIMGHPKEAFFEGGLDFMLHNHLDFETLNKKMFPEEIRHVNDDRPDNLSHVRFSKSYRFKSSEGKTRTILQRHTMINVNENKVPIAIFGFAWDITSHSENGKLVQQIEKFDSDSENWTLLLSKEYYPDIDQRQLLGKREIEILKWSVEGLPSKQIAGKLGITFNTINTHRRNMLRKTNCKNSLELLHYAIENKLL